VVSARHPALPAATGLALSSLRPGALSADGGRVAVVTFDSNLGAEDKNLLADAYVRDLRAGTNLLVSSTRVLPPGLAPRLVPGTNLVTDVRLSTDGRYASWVGQQFASANFATNVMLIWGDLARQTNVSVASGFSLAQLALGPDGRLVAFHSLDPLDRAMTDGNGLFDVFLRWMGDPGESPLSRNPIAVSSALGDGMTGNGTSVNPAFTPDGAWLVFQSTAGNVVGALNGQFLNPQLMARRIHAGPTNLPNFPFLTPAQLISYNTLASPAPDGHSIDNPLPDTALNPQFSADSRYVVFETASNLVYRHDLSRDFVRTIRSMQTAGGPVLVTNYARLTNTLVCTQCATPTVSGDGRFVAYESRDPAAGITNVLAKDLISGQIELISAGMAGRGADGSSFAPLLSHDGRYVVFTSRASNLVPNDNNRAMDVFVRDRLSHAEAISGTAPEPALPRARSSPPMGAPWRSRASPGI